MLHIFFEKILDKSESVIIWVVQGVHDAGKEGTYMFFYLLQYFILKDLNISEKFLTYLPKIYKWGIIIIRTY